MARPGHTAHFYSSDGQLVAETAQRIGATLAAGGAAVVIATPAHRQALEERLVLHGLDPAELAQQSRWIALDAAQTLAAFMMEGWPDARRFASAIGGALDTLASGVAHAGAEAPPIAAFCEMVALLWEEVRTGAAIRVEELWNELAAARSFQLSCGWPLRFFSRDSDGVALERVCSEHLPVVPVHGHNAMSEQESGRDAAPWQLETKILKAETLEAEILPDNKTQPMLRAGEGELRDYLDEAAIGMHWLAADGTIVWANRTVLHLLGYEYDQFVGHPFAAFVDNPAAAEEMLRRIRAAENVRSCELRFRCGDGTFRWIRIDGNPWLQDGTFLHARCFVLDITEKRRADEVQMKLAAIVESSDDAIASKDLNGIVTSWNAAAERILGWKAEEIIGKPITTVIPPELQSDEVEILRRIQAGERVEHFETVRVTKSGERIDVSLTISPMRNAQGTIVGAAKILRDVTLQKKLESALRTQERLAAVGRLAATVAHEINNPLEAVTNLIYLARQDPTVSEATRKCLIAADEELQRVSHIARQTLGFYRDTTFPVQVSIARAVGEILGIYERRFRNKQFDVRKDIPAGLTLCVLQGEFKQILSNLLSNAIDASGRGSRLDIRAWVAHHPVTGVAGIRLVVADRGTGIPEEIRRRIFMPFFTTKKDVGTGLGLWIVRDLLVRKGGSILCRSKAASADQAPEKSGSGTVMMIFLANQEHAVQGEVKHQPAA
ncbi:MAG TPA: PAS domain S-box protein [Acidobacteriaceae bacterium]|jgi:PAS domain S-box-containing protein|nr:PAS domain S-box protein [Acidobacteriaceae bacterium]